MDRPVSDPDLPQAAAGVGVTAWLAAVSAAGGAATLIATDRVTGPAVAALVVAAGWAVAAYTAHRADRRPLAWWSAVLAAGHAAVAVVPLLIPVLLAAGLCLGLALPDGSLHARWRRLAALAGVVGAAIWAFLLSGAGDQPGTGTTVVVAAACGAFALAAAGQRSRSGEAGGRRIVQWVAAGAVLAGAVATVLLTLMAVLEIPADPIAWVVGAGVLLPAGLALGVAPGSAPAGPAALVESLVVAGLAVFVVAVYLVVVVGLGRMPVDSEREVLVSSMAATLVVAVLAIPVRARLAAAASAAVGRGTGGSTEFASFGARMSRAVPMDELLLQLAESLRMTIAPAGAQVWIGDDGVLERTVAVPDRGPARLELGEHERIVVGRARSGGSRWMSVWLPDMLADHVARHGVDAPVRAVPVAHLGELLGLLLVQRGAGADAFTDEDERALVELARQLGLALHNVALDSALQASLAELRRRNAELQASRTRIVKAADESRRAIERNLHDGAQQHLVALAVKIGLARAVLTADPEQLPALLDQLRGEAQAAIGAVRELAHGIYPPLLRERGLGEALRTAAVRSPLRCAVWVDLPGRFPRDVETCVYFCCLEAIQNAGKHAGSDAEILVRVTTSDGRLRFAVSDDGAGFDPGHGGSGHGFVNMRDRLGAVGGELEIVSAPGAGATISGTIPVPATATPPA
ncbi:sensor histidine kinase [Pseudonocardia sp. TRM90224]|uniref:sensor histidine kinase n=1 Tax=Pseudonocardia sp. TRM90224 TaxID=2812678 RepID=UPI001E5F8808|nr:histidine kinase [Pseudonocardia sp. TRM90224]